ARESVITAPTTLQVPWRQEPESLELAKRSYRVRSPGWRASELSPRQRSLRTTCRRGSKQAPQPRLPDRSSPARGRAFGNPPRPSPNDLLSFDERFEIVESFFETLGIHALNDE